MIAYQEFLPARTLTDVYAVPLVQGGAVSVEVVLCNQSTLAWADVDVVVSGKDRQGDQRLFETGETNPTMLARSEYYLYRNHSLRPRKTLLFSLKLHIGETLRFKASTGEVSCTVMAEEFVTPDALHALEERLDVLVEDVLRLQEAQADEGSAPVLAGTDAARAAGRSNTMLRRYPLFDTESELVNGTGAILSLVINLETAARVESLLLKASSVTGTADVKAEYRMSWDGSQWSSFDDTSDITASTLLDRANNTEGWNTFSVSAPLNRYLQIRITGVAANPADSLIAAYLLVREEYARAER